MVYQLSREEVLKVCGTCDQFEKLVSFCKSDPQNRRQLGEVKKCKKWDEYFGGPCLYRGN